jgi:hypothetical protein
LAPPDPTVLSLVASSVTGAAMVLLGVHKRLLERPRRRRCPSCGRYFAAGSCRCTNR